MVHDDPDGVTVTGPAFLDSRSPEPGGLFAAFAGEQVDGHEYAARRGGRRRGRGAGGAPGRRPGRRRRRPAGGARPPGPPRPGRGCREVRVLAVTGSQGKTSTKDLLAAVLAADAPDRRDPRVLQQRARAAADRAARRRATRATCCWRWAPAGSATSRELCAIAPPDVSLVLNVGKAHLGEFGTQADIATAKGELVEALGRGRRRGAQRRRPAGRRDGASARRPGSLTFGTARAAPTSASHDLAARRAGPAARSRWPHDERRVPLSLRLVGEHQARNAAAAAAAAVAVGIPLRGRLPSPGAGRGPVPVADGGARTAPTASPWSTTPTTPTPTRWRRRCGPWSRSASGRAGRRAARSPCSARCASWASRATRSTRRSADWPCDWGCTSSWSSARPRVPCTAALARSAVTGGRERSRSSWRTTTTAVAWLARARAARRRRARQGLPRRAARRRRRGAARRRTDRLDAGRPPVRAILLSGGLALVFTLLGTVLAIRVLVAEGLRPADPRRRPDDPPHQARHARPWAAPSSSSRRRSAYLIATFSTGRTALGLRAAAAVPLRRARRGRLPRRLHQDRQAAQPRAAQPGQDDRPGARRDRLRRCWRCSSPTSAGQTPASRFISFTRDWEAWALPTILVVAADPADDRGHLQRREPHRRARRPRHRHLDDGVRRVHGHEHLAEQPVLRAHARATPATRSATRSTSPCWPPRSPAPASASCGGTPRRPRSSWATPARWRSAARSPASRSSPAPSCCWWSSAACSSRRPCR